MKALSLKELEQLDPSSLEIEEPQSDPLYEARLTWLLDNHPQRVAKLFRENPEALKAELLKNLQLASLELVRLRQKGRAQDEAEGEPVDGEPRGTPPGDAASAGGRATRGTSGQAHGWSLRIWWRRRCAVIRLRRAPRSGFHAARRGVTRGTRRAKLWP